MLFRSCATSFEFLVAYVYGSFIGWLSFLLKYLASLQGGACVLLVTGLMGLYSLCVLMKILSFDATGFICKYFCWFLSTAVLRLCIVCWIF